MEKPFKISVVTAVFNGGHTIRETIESVLKQNYPHWEHWIIDGGSTDGTLDIVKEYPHLKWISEKDEGHFHAMNKGIKLSTGEAIVLLNADDCFREGALEAVAKAFTDNPDWDGLFGDLVFVDGQGQEIYRRQEAKFDYNILRFGVCYVIHQTLFVKKAAYERIGDYRHKDLLVCADYELILRLGRERCKIGHVPKFLVSYRYHDHGMSADLRITRNMARESKMIQEEYGVPAGSFRKVLKTVYRIKRQCQKLLYRGRIDLVPGHWKTRRLMKAKTQFSSNLGLDKLES